MKIPPGCIPELHAIFAGDADYERCAEIYFRALDQTAGYLSAKSAPRPRFALLPRATLMLGDLAPLRDVLARNATARAMIDVIVELGQRLGISPPTYMMLRIFCDESGLEAEPLSMDDFAPAGVMRQIPITRGGAA